MTMSTMVVIMMVTMTVTMTVTMMVTMVVMMMVRSEFCFQAWVSCDHIWEGVKPRVSHLLKTA